MSLLSVENDFKKIFEAINDISKFLTLAKADSLEKDGIKQVLFGAHYVETLIVGLKKRGLSTIFEVKLNDYLKTKERIFVINVHQLEKFCDEVMSKILTLQPPYEIVSLAIEEYTRLLSFERLEELVNRLSQLRSLFVQFSHATKKVLTPPEVQSAFLSRSWLKILDSSESGAKDVENIMLQMFHDNTNAETLISILNYECEHISHVHNILIKVISSEVKSSPFSLTWIAFLQSEHLLNLLQKHPVLSDSVQFYFESMENRFQFDETNKLWFSGSSGDMDYTTFSKIVTSLYKCDTFHYKIKRFLRIRKVIGNTAFWEYIEEGLR